MALGTFNAFSVAQGYLTHHTPNTRCLSYPVVAYEGLIREGDGPVVMSSVVT